MNNIYYVYAWIRPDNNKIFYIGKGHGDRCYSTSSRNNYCLEVLNYFGGIKYIIIDIIESGLSENEAYKKEEYYIDYYKKLGHPLTNRNKGGLGSGDWFLYLTVEEQNAHREISKSFQGKHHSEETKQKMSKSAMGRKLSEEAKQKISESKKGIPSKLKGRKLSEEAKQKISESKKGMKCSNAKSVLCMLPDGKCEEIRSRTDAMDKYGYFVRTSVENNSNVQNLNNLYYYNNALFIYKQDLDRIRSQSTIEMVRIVDNSKNRVE
jgi:hypothetical protein